MKNIAQMMKQAQEMQSRVEEMQNQLQTIEVTGESGAGLVTVTMTGKGMMQAINIDPSLATLANLVTHVTLAPCASVAVIR